MVSITKAKRRYLKWVRYLNRGAPGPLGGIAWWHPVPKGCRKAWQAQLRARGIKQYGGPHVRMVDARNLAKLRKCRL